MATVNLSDLKSIRGDYSGLRPDARPEHASGQCIYREYTFIDAVKSDIFKVSNMQNDEIIAFFNTISSAEFKYMSEKDMLKFVSVALNVKHPVTGKNAIGQPYDPTLLCANYATAQPSESSKVSMEAESEASDDMVLVPATTQEKGQGGETETLEQKATAISFLLAWMTRFSVKTASIALNLQYKNVRETYMKMYQRSSSIFDTFKPSVEWMKCLRNAFDAFIRVKNTLVIYVAAAETASKADPKVFNLLRYLFFQNLEFMGMHSYVSIVSIMSKVALPPALILTWLRIGGAELALDEAYYIMANLDNGMIEGGIEKERLWKYARILDAGYFNRLQTAYAAELMATLAYIEIKLGISQETGHQSPLNIFAIANNKHVRDIGRAKAEAFMECKNKVTSLSKDASVIDRIYASRSGAATIVVDKEDKTDDMETEQTTKRAAEKEPVVPAKRQREAPGRVPPPPFSI